MLPLIKDPHSPSNQSVLLSQDQRKRYPVLNKHHTFPFSSSPKTGVCLFLLYPHFSAPVFLVQSFLSAPPLLSFSSTESTLPEGCSKPRLSAHQPIAARLTASNHAPFIPVVEVSVTRTQHAVSPCGTVACCSLRSGFSRATSSNIYFLSFQPKS